MLFIMCGEFGVRGKIFCAMKEVMREEKLAWEVKNCAFSYFSMIHTITETNVLTFLTTESLKQDSGCYPKGCGYPDTQRSF